MSRNRQSGFTIIELTLSMSFIAVMLVAIALCVIQLSTIYTRGETVRQLNQVMRVAIKDIDTTIQTAHPFDIDAAAVDAGRLCTGRYSYVWNTPTSNTNRYVNAADGQIRFIRVNDTGKTLCSNLSSHIVRSEATELMVEGDRSLMIHKMDIQREVVTGAAGQALYTMTMLVGTEDRDAIETTADGIDACKQSSSDLSSDLTYCAINEFTITVRAGIR